MTSRTTNRNRRLKKDIRKLLEGRNTAKGPNGSVIVNTSKINLKKSLQLRNIWSIVIFVPPYNHKNIMFD